MSNSKIMSLKYEKNTNIEIYKGKQGNYYQIENNNNIKNLFPINYDIHFPINWAINTNIINKDGFLVETGPENCINCKLYGHLNGVFVGYCMNCAEDYEYERGNGMTDLGVEVNKEMIALDLSNIEEKNSIWNTYLKNISIEEIGDENLLEEFTLYKDLPDLISVSDNDKYENQFISDNEEEDFNSDFDYDTEEEKLNNNIDNFVDNRRFDRYD